MKKLLALTALAALAACSQNDNDAASEEAMEAASTGGVAPGAYKVTTADGKVSHIELKADGTYVDTVNGEMTGSGAWTTTANQICFDGEGEEQEEQCWQNSPVNADGSWTATSATGEVVTITPDIVES